MVREEIAQSRNTVLRGRQALVLLYESFKTNTHMALIYSVTDLAKLQYPGDQHMHEFRSKWGLITGSLSDTPQRGHPCYDIAAET